MRIGIHPLQGSAELAVEADLVLLDANPLDGLATLRRPRAVISHSCIVTTAAGACSIACQRSSR